MCEHRAEGTGKQILFFWNCFQKESAQEVGVSPNKAIEECIVYKVTKFSAIWANTQFSGVRAWKYCSEPFQFSASVKVCTACTSSLIPTLGLFVVRCKDAIANGEL